jgi:hypothetical protein
VDVPSRSVARWTWPIDAAAAGSGVIRASHRRARQTPERRRRQLAAQLEEASLQLAAQAAIAIVVSHRRSGTSRHRYTRRRESCQIRA